MKGGKAGRKRRAGSEAAVAGDRKKPRKGNAPRPADAPPKKGSRKKSFGATSTKDEL